MLDPVHLRKNLHGTAERLALRGFDLDVDRIASLEEERKRIQIETEALQAQRNAGSRAMGKARAQGQDMEPLRARLSTLGDEIRASEIRLAAIRKELHDIALGVPNLTHESVPAGRSEDDNREERRWGELPDFDFAPLDHVELGARLGGMDFELASRLSGGRFVVLAGRLARLHRALTRFMLEVHVREHGYTEMSCRSWSIPRR